MITHPLQMGTSSQTTVAPLPCTPLKYQRLLRGWSQQDVADELYKRCAAEGKPDVAICAKLVGRWERGESKPRPIYCKHLCTLYALTAAELGLLPAVEVQP